MKKFTNIKQAVHALQDGQMIIIIDDSNRENEGDLVIAAQYATIENINFMTMHGRGIICTPMLAEDLDRLQIPLMVKNNTDPHHTSFTVSVDHISTTTGVSPEERASTIRFLAQEDAVANDFRRPGHVFPLRYHEGGVLQRAGHTEASIDLLRIAGLKPAAVICEITAEDGRMLRGEALLEFAQKYQLPVVSVADIIDYRKQFESLVTCVATSQLPSAYGNFKIYVYEDSLDNFNHLAIVKGDVSGQENVLTRIHSECLTGDIFGSKRCDCGEQLHAALERIEKEGQGVIVYMRQEGRGIGLVNKIRAYALQEEGLDTVEANEALGFHADLREYSLSAKILEDLQVKSIRLMTNNPDKLSGLEKYGVKISQREVIAIEPNECNEEYLHTKAIKMGHQYN